MSGNNDQSGVPDDPVVRLYGQRFIIVANYADFPDPRGNPNTHILKRRMTPDGWSWREVSKRLVPHSDERKNMFVAYKMTGGPI